ncbi:TetR/AcrR family transcriptional regulator [Psychrobacillus sp. OK032]|uniref:TetR/AcrR family transcriptional regulator n=1 Tax=Psychrobacillus sp. OK032 TaxID=1884358 RepID=UPI0008C531E5|nr:TetR/AcrR family transcriptional regulator [Psychrobacillus sp. OK032]SES31132.1 transcriptional regulator, TetR family [Psychrobacillus sp. OK032]
MIKKQLIMEKALELFAKQGFEATSVQQITDHCGISKGAFYLSFKSKDELILSLIDYFMTQFISDIDYQVRNVNNEGLLFKYYHTTFQSFVQHSDFAKILMNEQAQTFNNKELIEKLHIYDRLLDKVTLTMVERLYGDEIIHTKYDLVYCIKGLMNNYSKLILFYNNSLDLKLLSESLVEKTNLLAKHATIAFISEDIIHAIEQPNLEVITKEQLLEMITQKKNEMEESIEKESLILLEQQLLEPTLSPAIVKGLIENIRNHPHCKWISYLLRNYFDL